MRKTCFIIAVICSLFTLSQAMPSSGSPKDSVENADPDTLATANSEIAPAATSAPKPLQTKAYQSSPTGITVTLFGTTSPFMVSVMDSSGNEILAPKRSDRARHLGFDCRNLPNGDYIAIITPLEGEPIKEEFTIKR